MSCICRVYVVYMHYDVVYTNITTYVCIYTYVQCICICICMYIYTYILLFCLRSEFNFRGRVIGVDGTVTERCLETFEDF